MASGSKLEGSGLKRPMAPYGEKTSVIRVPSSRKALGGEGGIFRSRPKAEAELLHAIWTDPTPRYKTLLNKLYPSKPQLLLLNRPAFESPLTDE